MASKSEALSTTDIEELLDTVDQTMDRLKTLYEQYFMGIQRQAPSFLHTDVERKLRDLVQLNIRKTGLRFRLSTMQQKFGSYNAYWRRTLRQIENGTYIRNLAKIGREAARTGSEIPEEILAAMPKRMREQVMRDRDAALAIAKRRNQVDEGMPDVAELDAGAQFAGLEPPDLDDVAAMISEPAMLRREVKAQSAATKGGAHLLSDDDDLDFDKMFAAFEDGGSPSKHAAELTQKIAPPFRSGGQPTQPITTAVPRVPAAELLPRMASDTEPDALFAHNDEQATQKIPIGQQTMGIPRQSTTSIPKTQPVPVVPPTPVAPQLPRMSFAATPRSGVPVVPAQATAPTTTAIPKVPAVPVLPLIARPAPSQQSRPNPIAPGSSSSTPSVPVESMAGPFPRPEKPVVPTAVAAAPRPPPRPPVQPPPRPVSQTPSPKPAAPLRLPPGMTEADVNALHAKYVQAKQMVGEKVDERSREKLLKTINQTAPKVMEQYKASGVDFSVVVKDNQVVIKAKPKT